MDLYSSFIITAKTWRQPRCLSVGKQISNGTSRQWNIIQYKEEMSYYVMKSYTGTLKAYYLVREANPEKATHCMIPRIQHSRKSKTMETVKTSVVARGQGQEG